VVGEELFVLILGKWFGGYLRLSQCGDAECPEMRLGVVTTGK